MRVTLVAVAVLAVAASGPAAAQAPAAGGNPVSQAVRAGWNAAKQNLSGSAKVMPEAKFTFKPVETVRSFGAILAHVAGANYVFCAAARGEKPPHAEDAFEKSATTKEAIIKALDESFKYCDAAYAGLTDATLGEMVAAPFGEGKSARAQVLMGNTGHLQEHYGNLVTYLRINGLVPPSSTQ